jgi:hypothetical protein
MFIGRNLRTTRRGSEGRNETRLVPVKMSSAPQNRAGDSHDDSAINMRLLTELRTRTS